MSDSSSSPSVIYKISKFFSYHEIKLSARTKTHNVEVLVLYVGSGTFIYQSLCKEACTLKQIPWFEDHLHTPVSIAVSPSGCHLLVLSRSCNLYLVPICSVFNPGANCDSVFDTSDITIHLYPFTSKVIKDSRLKVKCPKFGVAISSNTLPQSLKTQFLSKSHKLTIKTTPDIGAGENDMKFEDVFDAQCNAYPTVACWWHSQNSQEIGIIGTKSGDIIFVDLFTGIKLGETYIKNEITNISLCQGSSYEYVYLLITASNREQHKLILEQKQFICIWSDRRSKSNGSNEESASVEEFRSPPGNGVAPSTRNRLQGLKQMSAEKLASLKNKIAETRSKMAVKHGSYDENPNPISSSEPENLTPILGDTVISYQKPNDDFLLVGYNAHTQMLTVYSLNLEIVPHRTHKLPAGIQEILFCDKVIFVTSEKNRSITVLSSKLTESPPDQQSEFNPDSVLGKWTLGREEKEVSNTSGNTSQALKDAPENFAENEEIILSIYSSTQPYENFDTHETYKVTRSEVSVESPKVENCIVVTNKNVYVIRLESNVIKVALDFILNTHELEKVERICTVFGISLQKLLELAGDIKLEALEFPTAIALYKLSKCGPLKSIVKLACGSHCAQVLNYSSILMSNSNYEASLTEKIHLSNLILMAYTQQILKSENNRNLMQKFIEFLECNSHFDEVLAVSITGQSLLFGCLQKLITCKGLTLDGYNVLLKLMERFLTCKTLVWTLNREEFWTCATEISLGEALVVKYADFSTYSNYILLHLDELDLKYLDRILNLSDPTAPRVRSVARLFSNSNDCREHEETRAVFPFGKLVELFLITLLVKLSKKRSHGDFYKKEYLLPCAEDLGTVENRWERTCTESLATEDFGGIGSRLPRNHFTGKSRNKKRGSILSCGYGHTALVRNNSLYTWGQTAKGCLGHGPTMSRYSSPASISWLNAFRLKVFSVSCGKHHTAVLTDNGVYTWGCSRYGQLGLGDIRESPYPRLVDALADESLVAVCCGQFHTLALTTKGYVFAWGWGVHGQLGLGSVDDQRYPKHFIVDVAAGHGHSLALSDSGDLYSFGSGVFGQLGTGNTNKSSLPILVKGFNGKIISMATGYFHNVALTDTDSLYTWGLSPQCLRFQAQAKKRLRLLKHQNPTLSSPTNFEPYTPPINESSQRILDEIPESGAGVLDKAESESHLSPQIVDTTSVVGKIVQISCGCHHSALVTDCGGIYTWGRSLDGQLGNGSHREVPIPTQINKNTFRADCVSCGCEFTTAIERHTGKIFSWGSNSVGQLAIPIKESATKALDGKLIMLKSCKRIVRLLDRNSGSNSLDVPKELQDIPSPTFAYPALEKCVASSSRNLPLLDPNYSQKSLHFVTEIFKTCINLSFLLNKSLQYGNYQLASKVLLLQSKWKQSFIYQLKALQNCSRYHSERATFVQNQRMMAGEVEEDTSGSTRSEDVISYNQEKRQQTPNANDAGEEMTTERPASVRNEYIDHATFILYNYLTLNPSRTHEDLDGCSVLEIGIQFWAAEKLPISALEEFLFDRLDVVSDDFARLLIRQNNEKQIRFDGFTSKFLLTIISRVMGDIEGNRNHVEYLEVMSKVLVKENIDSFNAKAGKKKTEKERKERSELFLETIRENLKGCLIDESCIKISSELEINDEHLATNLCDIYEALERNKRSNTACPSCVRNYLNK